MAGGGFAPSLGQLGKSSLFSFSFFSFSPSPSFSLLGAAGVSAGRGWVTAQPGDPGTARCGVWGGFGEDFAPLTQQPLPVLDEDLGRGHHLFVRAVLAHRVDRHPDARGLGTGVSGAVTGTPPGPPKPCSTSPPHLQQLDGHGVTGERLEQIQRPFLQRGEATGALEELRPPRDHPMGSPEGLGQALRATWPPSVMLP